MLQLQTIPHYFRDPHCGRLQFHVITTAKTKERGEKGEQTICTTCQLSDFSSCSLSTGQSKQHDIDCFSLRRTSVLRNAQKAGSQEHSVNSTNHQHNGRMQAKHCGSYCRHPCYRHRSIVFQFKNIYHQNYSSKSFIFNFLFSSPKRLL